MAPPGPRADTQPAASRSDHAWLLYRGVRNLLRCDEAQVVSGIARYVLSQDERLRAGTGWIEKNRESVVPPLLAVGAALKSILRVRSRRRPRGIAWIARHSNERHAIEGVLESIRSIGSTPKLEQTEFQFGWAPSITLLVDLVRFGRGPLRRIFRIARRLHRRREYFKVIRVAELIGYYLRYLRLFEAGGVTLAVTSNHSNPHGLGFTLAARKCGIPVALITHGMPVQPVARLEYALAVVHCEAARRIYLDGGCRMDRILIHGRSRRYVSMSTVRLPGALTVGIFLCKDVNQDQLDNLCKRLLRHPQVSRIVIRPHPTNLWKGFDQWTGSQPHRVLRSRTQSVFDDIQTAHIVLGGNSSVLVDAVIAGKPSGYVPGLDCGAPDFHGFVASGLIYPIDKEPGFDPAMMMQFYLRPEWRATLRRFANIDEEESAVAAKAGAAMRDLARRQDKGSLQNESTSEVGSSWLKI